MAVISKGITLSLGEKVLTNLQEIYPNSTICYKRFFTKILTFI